MPKTRACGKLLCGYTNMVKQGIKNYLSSLKYFFTPLGTMFLGMMIGFSVFIPAVSSAVSALIKGVQQLAANVNLDFNTLLGIVWSDVTALDWNDPLGAIGTILSNSWLHGVFTDALQSVLGTDFETFSNEVVTLISDFIGAITVAAVAFFVCWIIGFIAGFFVVRFQIRKDIAKRTLWKIMLAGALNSVLTTAYVMAALILFSMWGWSAIISLILLILFTAMFALFEAWLIHGRRKVTLKSIVNAKNAGLYALTSVIIFAISIVITVIACCINGLMGLFVGLAIVEIAIIVTDLNAESYVKSQVSAQ